MIAKAIELPLLFDFDNDGTSFQLNLCATFVPLTPNASLITSEEPVEIIYPVFSVWGYKQCRLIYAAREQERGTAFTLEPSARVALLPYSGGQAVAH